MTKGKGSIGGKMDAARGRSSGFDYLRLVLSLLIIAFHTAQVCYGREAESQMLLGTLRPMWFSLVPAFFAMSGFLIAGSLERTNTIPAFLALRGLRILPALCCEVLISAILIGPMLTSFGLASYFSSQVFYSYFLNIIGIIHYALPGVFMYNHVDWVNIQLWTIPCELECLVILSCAVFAGLFSNRRVFTLAVFVFTLYAYIEDTQNGLLRMDFRPPEYMIIACCLWGVVLSLYRYEIPCNFVLFAASVAVTWWAFSGVKYIYIAALPIVYITVYLGLLDPRRIFIVSSGDYSYGLYLYGYPIQQAIYQVLPGYRQWYAHLPLSLMASGICAYLSWHYLESKVLARKKQTIAYIASLKPRDMKSSA